MTQIFPAPATFVVIYQIEEGPNAGTFMHLNQTGYLVESVEVYRDHAKPSAPSVLLDRKGHVWDEASGWFVDPSPKTADGVRREIVRLEGSLSRLSGEPLVIWEGRDGGITHRADEDIPPGGALLDYEVSDMHDQAWARWYPSTEAAKAAMVALWREHQGDLSKNGLDLDAEPIRAWITRRS